MPDGGIIITASHNPKQWNALKLLNEQGEFLNGAEGEKILALADSESFSFADVDDLGTYTKDNTYLQKTHSRSFKFRVGRCCCDSKSKL